jgi:hypothetical protein
MTPGRCRVHGDVGQGREHPTGGSCVEEGLEEVVPNRRVVGARDVQSPQAQTVVLPQNAQIGPRRRLQGVPSGPRTRYDWGVLRVLCALRISPVPVQNSF